MQIFESNTISEVLGRELARRTQRNASYSLRAFARDLELSPSRLSEVMKGKHGLSENSLDLIVKRLSKKVREQNYLRDIVLAEFSRNKEVRSSAKTRVEVARQVESTRKLQADEFSVISQWYHGALIELMQLPEFQADPKWIGKRLGIRPSTAAAAIQRLENLSLIVKVAEGKWEINPQAATAFSSVPSIAVRKFHQQILSMHAESLHQDQMDERELLSMILAIPRSRLPELKEELRKFHLQFWQKIADEPKDDLYSFSIQLCPVRNRRPGATYED